MLLGWHAAAQATAVRGTLAVLHKLDSPDGAHMLAVLLMLGSVLSIIGVLFRIGWPRLLFFLLQQILLGIEAGAGVLAAWCGGVAGGSCVSAYLDGTLIPWPHICIEQTVFILVFWIHFAAGLQRCMD